MILLLKRKNVIVIEQLVAKTSVFGATHIYTIMVAVVVALVVIAVAVMAIVVDIVTAVIATVVDIVTAAIAIVVDIVAAAIAIVVDMIAAAVVILTVFKHPYTTRLTISQPSFHSLGNYTVTAIPGGRYHF